MTSQKTSTTTVRMAGFVRRRMMYTWSIDFRESGDFHRRSFSTDENKIRQITKQLNNTWRFPSASPKSNAILTFTYQTKQVSVERLGHGYLVQYVKNCQLHILSKRVCLGNWSLDTGHMEQCNDLLQWPPNNSFPMPNARSNLYWISSIYRYGTWQNTCEWTKSQLRVKQTCLPCIILVTVDTTAAPALYIVGQ